VSELAATEATHLAASPTYRASVSIAEDDIDVYLQWPDIIIRDSHRWEALQFDWAP
jgi:hypothetical protein